MIASTSTKLPSKGTCAGGCDAQEAAQPLAAYALLYACRAFSKVSLQLIAGCLKWLSVQGRRQGLARSHTVHGAKVVVVGLTVPGNVVRGDSSMYTLRRADAEGHPIWMTPYMDDAAITQWAIAAQRGDRDAAASFIHATTGQLRRVLRYPSDSEQADDLAQETYLRAFAALPRYAARSPARLWLLSIARRVAADHVRQARRRPRLARSRWDNEVDRQHFTPGPAGLVELEQAIAVLEPSRREAFVLTRVLGLSYSEAADMCDCPIGTIRSRVFCARVDLLAALDEQDAPSSALGP